MRQSYSKPKAGRFLGHGVEAIHSTASVRETVYDTGCIYVKRRIAVYVQAVYSIVRRWSVLGGTGSEAPIYHCEIYQSPMNLSSSIDRCSLPTESAGRTE